MTMEFTCHCAEAWTATIVNSSASVSFQHSFGHYFTVNLPYLPYWSFQSLDQAYKSFLFTGWRGALCPYVLYQKKYRYYRPAILFWRGSFRQVSSWNALERALPKKQLTLLLWVIFHFFQCWFRLPTGNSHWRVRQALLWVPVFYLSCV